MDSSPRSPMRTNSMADSPTCGGGAMEEGTAPGAPVGGGVPYNPYGGSGSAGYVGYYMGPPHGMVNGGVPHGGYGTPYGGAMGPVGPQGVVPPPPHHAYAMQSHPHPQAPYGNRGVQGPPGGPLSNGMPSQYGGGYGVYEYYGAGSGGQPMKPQQQPLPHQAMQGERTSPSSPSSKSTRGGFHGHGSSPRSTKDLPSSGSKSSPLESRTDESSPARATSGKNAGDSDVDRAKSAAEAELTPSLVKPLQSDFHFFVLAVKDRLRLEAEQEVQSSLADNSKVAHDSQQLQYLINTNLNARLMNEWEDMKLEHKEEYLKKEEEDRKRFMEEDAVASRHCATLTARVKSHGDVVGGGSKETSPARRKHTGKDKPLKSDRDGGDDSESDGDDDPDLQLQATESQDGDDDDDGVLTNEKEPKRSPGEASQEDQSPSKKNRSDEDKSDEQQ